MRCNSKREGFDSSTYEWIEVFLIVLVSVSMNGRKHVEELAMMNSPAVEDSGQKDQTLTLFPSLDFELVIIQICFDRE
jgi:hypothetical protein